MKNDAVLFLINRKLQELKLYVQENINEINIKNDDISALKLKNDEWQIEINEFEDAAIILKGNEFLKSKRSE